MKIEISNDCRYRWLIRPPFPDCRIASLAQVSEKKKLYPADIWKLIWRYSQQRLYQPWQLDLCKGTLLQVVHLWDVPHTQTQTHTNNHKHHTTSILSFNIPSIWHLGQGERTFKEQTIEQIPWWAQLLARKVGKLNWVMMCKQAHIGVLCTFSNHIVNAAKECVLFFLHRWTWYACSGGKCAGALPALLVVQQR